MAVLVNRLRIAVVGAGIAGLAAVAALARAGQECAVIEQAERLAETGAGLQLAPNATRLLRRLGLAEVLSALAVRPAALELRRWSDGSILGRTMLGAACESAYGAPYCTLHRGELHAALLRAVRPARLYLGRRLVEHAGEVELGFADGTRCTADVVIGADGIRSAVRGTVDDTALIPAGLTVHRGLVPADRLPHLISRPRVRIWLGPGRHCVCYPVSAGQLVSFAAVLATDPAQDGSWGTPGDPADLRDAFAGWHPEVTRLLAAADAVTRWTLYDRPPLDRWCTPRVALLGDAAHPMLPLGAQGANQAIEDAFALAVCLRGVGADGVEQALRRFERVRVPRLAAVLASVRRNAGNHHLADGASQRARDRTAGRAHRLSEQSWLYGYDAETEAQNQTRGSNG